MHKHVHYITFSHLADAFIQSNLQMRTMVVLRKQAVSKWIESKRGKFLKKI